MAKELFPEYMVMDGGFATELAWAHGHQYIDGDPLWSARLLHTNPDLIKKVHRSFLDVGSSLIETATYQASVDGFMNHLNLSKSDAFQLIKYGGELAVQARDEFWESNGGPEQRKPLVAGSLGPYGAHLGDGSEYSGKYVDSMTLDDLMNWHRPQVSALAESGVDILALESIPAQKEAEALCNLLKEFSEVQAWISFTCSDFHHLCHGEKFEEAVQSVAGSEQIIAVGLNCTPPECVETLLSDIPNNVKQEKNIVIYPNSGETWTEEKTWYKAKEVLPIEMYVPQWLDKGANWIGGCCRVTVKDILKIKKIVDSYTAKSKAK